MTAIREKPLAMIGVLGITWILGILTFGTYVFMGTYLYRSFNFSLSLTTFIVTVSLCADAIAEPFIAKIADRIGLLPVIKVGLLALFLFSLPIFYLISSGKLSFITLGMVGISLIIALICAPMNAYLVSLFPKEYRYSGLGISFNLGISLFGGPTPFLMLWLVNRSDDFLAPAWYYMFGALIGLCSLAICEYSRRSRESKSAIAF